MSRYGFCQGNEYENNRYPLVITPITVAQSSVTWQHVFTMRDEHGSYYYPNPVDVKSRVYVRQGLVDIEFRLWHADHPQVWEKHGWLSRTTLAEAAAVYRERGSGADPLLLYDVSVARALLKEEAKHA